MNLFDDKPAEPTPHTHSTWREAPQALFLSWSVARQLSYCAARDEDAATYCDGPEEEKAWHRARAAAYREDVRNL